VTVEWRSVIAWLGIFLAWELPARDVLGLWPWYSLSKTTELGVGSWWPLAIWLVAFMAILLGHFEPSIHLSWRWVVLAGAAGAALVLSHLIRQLAA
jgi:hypothetical protein